MNPSEHDPFALAATGQEPIARFGDAFAQAAGSVAAAAGVRAVPAVPATPAFDPFASASELDDPFVTSADAGSAGGPWPKLPDVYGRLIVAVPRDYEPSVPIKGDSSGRAQERCAFDMYVLSGGDLRFYSTVTGNPAMGTPDSTEVVEVSGISPESPYEVRGMFASQAHFVKVIKAAHRGGRPALGVILAGATADGRRSGRTDAMVDAAYRAHLSGGPGGPPAPQLMRWVLADPSPEQRAIAVRWWMVHRSEIPPIVARPDLPVGNPNR